LAHSVRGSINESVVDVIGAEHDENGFWFYGSQTSLGPIGCEIIGDRREGSAIDGGMGSVGRIRQSLGIGGDMASEREGVVIAGEDVIEGAAGASVGIPV